MPAVERQTWIVGSQSQVATFFGVATQTVHVWRAHGMPGKPRCYDLSEILVWLRSNGPWREKLARTLGDDDAFDDADSKSRKLQAEADLLEMRVERVADQLIPRDIIQHNLHQVANAIRGLGESFGRMTIPISGQEAQKRLNETLTSIQWEIPPCP
jgi:phage terminase Nu1 subunit (DNA packaging protein)